MASPEEIKQIAWQAVTSKHPDADLTTFEAAWVNVIRTGIVDKLIEKINEKAKPKKTLAELEAMAAQTKATKEKSEQNLERNNIALQMIKYPDFNREIVNDLFNGLGSTVNLGKEGSYGAGFVLKRKLNLQQFYTHTLASKLIADLLKIPNCARIIDFTCGSGRLFYHMPNQFMLHGIEFESDAYLIARALYPNGRIIQDDASLHMHENQFDYVVGNPPFTLYWEDHNGIFKNHTASNRMVSEQAVMEQSIRGVRDGGYIAMVMAENVFEEKFEESELFLRWMLKHLKGIAKIDLPSDTHVGTAHPTSLYIFKKEAPYRDEKAKPVMVFAYHGQLAYFNEEEIKNIVQDCYNNSYNIEREIDVYAESRKEQPQYDLTVQEIIKYDPSEYIKSSATIASDDYLVLDVPETDIFNTRGVNLILEPNGLHAALKIRNIHSKHPLTWSRSRNEYVDEFRTILAQLDQFMNPAKSYDEVTLIKESHAYDMEVKHSPSFVKTLAKRKEWIDFQDTPFTQWIDPDQDFSWKLLHENNDVMAKYPEQWEKWSKALESLESDPQYIVYMDFIKKKDNWIKHLFPYQSEDAIRMAMKSAIIHGGGMGLGKTRSSIAAMLLKGDERNLIVVPSKLITTWEEEFEGLGLPAPYVVEYVEDLPEIDNHKFCIISYSALRMEKDRRAPKSKMKKYRKNPDYEDDIEFENAILGYFEDSMEREVLLGTFMDDIQSNPDDEDLTQAQKDAIAFKETPYFADNLLDKFGCVCIDEVHNLSNPLTKQTQAAWRLNPKNWIFLSGTPIKNRVNGLLSPLIIGWGEATLMMPYTKEGFLDTFLVEQEITVMEADAHGYLQSKKKKVKLPKINNPEKLQSLLAGKIIRRTKYEPAVSTHVKFPNPEIRFIEIEPSKEEKEYSKQWYDEYVRLKKLMVQKKDELKQLKNRAKWGMTEAERLEIEAEQKELKTLMAIVVVMIGKLRFVALSPQIDPLGTDTTEADDGEEDTKKKKKMARVEESALRRLINIPVPYRGGVTPRQQQVLDELVRRVKNGEQCYTITYFKDFYDYFEPLLKKEGVKTVIIRGGMTLKNKKKILQDYRDKKIDVILATIGVFDVGINIPHASYCAIIHPDWNWSDMEQAYSRFIRPQSKGTRTVEFFVLKTSIETYVRQIAEMKRVNAEYVIDYGPTPPETKWVNNAQAIEAMFKDLESGEFYA